jgi:peptide/nickel transport system substrate-binding protein
VFLKPDGSEVYGPDFAESYEQIDAVTYVFRLRKGVRFSPDMGFPLSSFPGVNDREVTAHDVVWTEKYLKEGPTTVQQAWHPWKTVEAVDKYAVKFTLAQPNADFLWLLANGRGGPAVLAREVYEKLGTFKNGPMISIGPWVLKSANWTTGLWEFVKNPNYYIAGTDGKSLPYLDGFTVRLMTDSATALSTLRSGETKYRFLNKTESDVLRQENQKWTFDDVAYRYTASNGLWLNRNRAPLNNEEFCRAIIYATDPYEQISNAGGPNWGRFYGGYALPYVSWLKDFEAATKPYVANLEKAKESLAKSGVNTPLTLMLEVRDTSLIREAQLCQNQLARVGIDTKIVQRDGTFTASTLYSNKWPDGQLYYTTYSTLPVSNWIFITLHSSGTYAKALGINDKKLDVMIEAQQQELDVDKRKAMLRDIEVYALEHGLSNAGWAQNVALVSRPEFHVRIPTINNKWCLRYLADAWIDA